MLKKFRVRYFVLADHPTLGHTRMSEVFDCHAVDKADAIGKAEAHSRKHKRVKVEDFKHGPFEQHAQYPIKDEFNVEELNG